MSVDSYLGHGFNSRFLSYEWNLAHFHTGFLSGDPVWVIVKLAARLEVEVSSTAAGESFNNATKDLDDVLPSAVPSLLSWLLNSCTHEPMAARCRNHTFTGWSSIFLLSASAILLALRSGCAVVSLEWTGGVCRTVDVGTGVLLLAENIPGLSFQRCTLHEWSCPMGKESPS